MAVRDIDNKTLDYIQNSLENHNVVFSIISAKYVALEDEEITTYCRGHLYLTIQLLSGNVEDIYELVICDFANCKKGGSKNYRYNTILATSVYSSIDDNRKLYVFDFNVPNRNSLLFTDSRDLSSITLPTPISTVIDVEDPDAILDVSSSAKIVSVTNILDPKINDVSTSFDRDEGQVYLSLTFEGTKKPHMHSYSAQFGVNTIVKDFPNKLNHRNHSRIVRARRKIENKYYNNSNVCFLGISIKNNTLCFNSTRGN